MSTTNTWKEKIVQTEGSQITIGEQLGAGDEGGVYCIQSSQSEVLKIFNEDIRNEKVEKVEAMIANEPQDPTDEQQGKQSIAWPEAVVEDNSGVFIGYTMPKIDVNSAKDAFQYAVQELDWNKSSPRDRHNIVLNLVIMVWTIHDQGHAIGDFNQKNILIDDRYITLIDCDGFHISGDGSTYHGKTFSKRYAPPEKRGQTLKSARRGDLFCLSIHIFQLLMEGHHPYIGKGPAATSGNFRDKIQKNEFPYSDPEDNIEPPDDAPEYHQLPAPIRREFEKTFTEAGKKAMYGRTEVEEWIEVLVELTGANINTPSRTEKSINGLSVNLQEDTVSQGPYVKNKDTQDEPGSRREADMSVSDEMVKSNSQLTDQSDEDNTRAREQTSKMNIRGGPYGSSDPEQRNDTQSTENTDHNHVSSHGEDRDNDKSEDIHKDSDDKDDYDEKVRKGPYS